MGRPMNYASAAGTYADHCWALPWKLAPLLELVEPLAAQAGVLEVGCGTGDYLHALHVRVPERRYQGFDVSAEMLERARERCAWAASLQLADADRSFPCEDASEHVVYAVDVLHHLQQYERFFAEAARSLQPGGRLAVITDSADDIHARSLAKYFPTTVAINLERYPALGALEAMASGAGLRLESRRTLSGRVEMDDKLLESVAAKAMSELRMIPSEEHALGMERVRMARAQKLPWVSQTTVLTWSRP